MLENSAFHIKQHGFAASGVDAIAAAAGVTSGSLYKHFAGKTDLFASVIRADLQRMADRYASIETGDEKAVEKVISAYLSDQHVRHPGRGCPLPALTAEVARSDDAVRAAFDEGLREVHATLEPFAGSSAKAWALVSQSVGAVMLARAALDPELRRELLESARAETGGLISPRRARAREQTS